MIALVLGALIAVAAVVIVALPFIRDNGEPELIDFGSESEEILELIEERDRALAALKELEFDHRTGKVDDEDYRETVGPLRRQAAEALQALDARTGKRSTGEGSAAEDLGEQEHVQGDDHDGDSGRDDVGEPAVDERAHQVAARREPDQRNERERDPEREHDL